MFDKNDHPHRRLNPLTGDYVLVSPHRAKRPWQGAIEPDSESTSSVYEHDCFLCPTNTRINGAVNPDYDRCFVFENDFAALTHTTPTHSETDPLFSLEAAAGCARVVCYSPDHSKTLPELDAQQIEAVIDTWVEQSNELFKDYRWVQIFENKGEAMGCSQPHPHGQIWASDFLPNEVRVKDEHQAAYFKRHGSALLLDYARRERDLNERVVVETEHWLGIVPFWAAWPFETMLLPKQAHIPDWNALNDDSKRDLAVAIKQLTTHYDNLFHCSFPYSMGWHHAPDDASSNHWQLHASFYPPLLRSATVKKYMVGYEMLAEPQRDLTPEQAADKLKATSSTHYKKSAV